MDQQLRLGRIVLQDTQAAHQQVTIDLVFEGNKVRTGITYFGVWEDLNEGSMCPFVMNESGQCDFGTGYSGEDRVYQFDVLTAPVGQDFQIGWRSDQYETQMKVVSITQMV
ncbi:MAG TPA: hypothetical protein VFB68_01175 [Xanthobacteraceae bacterium]|nr:hypothetical protein [Xanthobacteraceae bacterium]